MYQFFAQTVSEPRAGRGWHDFQELVVSDEGQPGILTAVQRACTKAKTCVDLGEAGDRDGHRSSPPSTLREHAELASQLGLSFQDSVVSKIQGAWVCGLSRGW